MLLILYLWFI